MCVNLPSELQSDKLSARKSEKGSAGPMSSEPSWTSPPLRQSKNIHIYSVSGSVFVSLKVCLFGYLKEILNVLTTVESRNISGKL